MITQFLSYLRDNEQVLLICCLILILLAYFVNLGLTPIMADEPTRAVVAMEMIFSENYIVPTINGELYYNKPPFYNWILALLFELTDNYSELMVRLPSVIPLMLFGLTIYSITRYYLSSKIGIIAGIMYVTCGRMLVYSGLLGHIDIFYSWLTFLGFIAVLYFYERGQLLALFLITYIITAIGLLCKGLPSIVFQGITLLTFFIYQHDWRKLFSWQHILGGLLFLSLIGSYYYTYFQFNPDIDGYFANLWTESSKRTVLDKAWYESLLHPFTFPFEQIMHLLPWSLFVVFLFRRGMWNVLMSHPFLKFSILILAANSIVYWLSPQTYPRYLFMLYPFIFILIAYGYVHYRNLYPRINRILEYIFLSAGILAGLGIWAVLGVNDLDDIPFRELKVIALFTGFVFALYLYDRLPLQRFIIFTIVMMLFRLGFDWFVLPHRYKNDQWTPSKDAALEVVEIVGDSPLYVFPGYEFEHHLTYYIERERRELLPVTDELYEGAYYICTDSQLLGRSVEIHYEFDSRLKIPLNLVTFKSN